jgi:hypothetical protein
MRALDASPLAARAAADASPVAALGAAVRRAKAMCPWWVGAWLRDRAAKAARVRPPQRHVLICVCDHFEPLHGRASWSTGQARVLEWRRSYPELARKFADSTGRPPRHTFFFPGEQYDRAFVEPLAELIEQGLAEVEVHLHHDGDTRGALRERLLGAVEDLGEHGVISTRAGRPAWAFIHGNWALSNGRPDRRWCGVDDELALLREVGCYADFTFPCAPDPCQPRVVNAIYYAADESRRRAYDEAERVAVGRAPRDRVLLIQGPLAVVPRAASRYGARIDAASLHASDPPTDERLRTWLDQWVHVPGRPEWTFVKLHAHGAPEKNAAMMLGAPMAAFHEALAERVSLGWRVHYVTAREMYNIARAAMDGWAGSPADYRDYVIAAPPRAPPERAFVASKTQRATAH